LLVLKSECAGGVFLITDSAFKALYFARVIGAQIVSVFSGKKRIMVSRAMSVWAAEVHGNDGFKTEKKKEGESYKIKEENKKQESKFEKKSVKKRQKNTPPKWGSF